MKNGNILDVVWTNPDTNTSYTVGRLTNNNGFTFKYCKDYKSALKVGWNFIRSFPEVKEYKSNVLFPIFSSRLPDRKRKDIKTILKKYGLSNYDGFDLLKKSEGKLPIDSYKFLSPKK